MYGTLLDRFYQSLQDQAPTNALGIKEQDITSAPMRIPFWEWRHQIVDTRALLYQNREDPHISWQWPLLGDHLHLCHATFSQDSLEIEAPCTPINDLASFREAQRRLFLTATLADDSVLISTFDADPDVVVSAISPDSASDIGDRMILSPQEINPTISEEDMKETLARVAREVNIVVLSLDPPTGVLAVALGW